MWGTVCKKYQLTQRETEIIGLVYKGRSNPDIGRSLFIAENTVKKHMNHIFRKTETKNRYELMNRITEEVKTIHRQPGRC
jgi:DNA-binding NarL/FixJ family response regulator